MNRWQNRVAVITGASSGIGAACTRLIVAAGVQVVGLARRTERMEQLKQSLPSEQHKLFQYRQCDVSKEDDVQSAFEWVEKNLGGIDILVSNAGILRNGNVVDMPTNVIKDVVNTNFMGAVYSMQQAVKSMKNRDFAGHLIFINSTAGLPGFKPSSEDPSLNMYTPTKYALSALSEICRQELITLKTKIKTTSICPGWVATEIVPADTAEALGDVILQDIDVANAVMYALSTPPHVQVQEIALQAVGEWF